MESRMVHTMCTRDVNYVCMPRSTLPQMIGMVESVTQTSAAKMRDSGERVNITYPDVVVCVNLFGHLSSSGYGGVIANTDCPAEIIEQAALDYTNEIIKMHQFLRTKESMLCVLTLGGLTTLRNR